MLSISSLYIARSLLPPLTALSTIASPGVDLSTNIDQMHATVCTVGSTVDVAVTQAVAGSQNDIEESYTAQPVSLTLQESKIM